ncbi:toll/interleukin-1 receptor domain-containing protein [Hymenobacter sp. NST-14]|uniref:toll/interleukin-1 receptor domain-containing protein n=1 Tax=Hymenobacter piscis TaxID=2839984 RepID=UPI001C010158|nr:toll/interleukin-1 receptor domain-containing protein [Hymenobacter piscis]MBT9394385.1 toll/interleukin-1 receptor domain-containing protein [Hymenobacter piscis]
MKEHPVCLISYSWDSQGHKDWVRRLADDLIQYYSIDVKLDQYELHTGADIMHFMERNIEHADKVVLILTPAYKEKASARSGGVGAEWSMISQGLYNAQTNQNKFLPVLRVGTSLESAPLYLQSRAYHSMADDTQYMVQLDTLARSIREVPLLAKPALGPVPDFTSPGLDPLLRQMKELANEQALNRELDRFLTSAEGVELANQQVQSLYTAIEEKAQLYNAQPDVDIHFSTERTAPAFLLTIDTWTVVLNWEREFGNSLTGASLHVAEWYRRPTLRGGMNVYHPSNQPRKCHSVAWSFDLDRSRKPIWRSGQETKTMDEMVSDVFHTLILHSTSERSSFRQ